MNLVTESQTNKINWVYTEALQILFEAFCNNYFELVYNKNENI